VKIRSLAIVSGLIVVLGIGLWSVSRSAQNASSSEVRTVGVERGGVELTVSADGTLQPLTTVAVRSYAGGRVDVLAVEVGDEVKPGDLIAKIDPTDSLTAYNQAVAAPTAADARQRQARERAQFGGQRPGAPEGGIASAGARAGASRARQGEGQPGGSRQRACSCSGAQGTGFCASERSGHGDQPPRSGES
jgi:multidrug efflux pump subunit AcrA (membrane-fusion protein)